MCVNNCSIVLVVSQRACVVGNSVGRARIGACRCQVGLDKSEYRLSELREGVSREKSTYLVVLASVVQVGT